MSQMTAKCDGGSGVSPHAAGQRTQVTCLCVHMCGTSVCICAVYELCIGQEGNTLGYCISVQL